MDPDAERVRRLLDEIERSVAEFEAIELDAEHRRLIAAVEALPENQDGTDKSWLWQRYTAYRAHFAAAEPEGPWTRSRATPQP